MLDLGKLIFGSIFLGGILRGGLPHALLVLGGFFVAFIFIIVGLLFASTMDEGEV
jgi:hypothetical protein